MTDNPSALAGFQFDSSHRYYFWGKLIRQDLGGSEPGYRSTLHCPHCGDVVEVWGPDLGYYYARCTCTVNTIDKPHHWRERTLGELWRIVEQQGSEPNKSES